MGERTCSVDGCERPTGVPGSARGWCGRHYQRWQKHGDVQHTRSVRVGVTPCSIKGCMNVVKARGWCVKHWTRWKRLGDPEARLRGEVRDGKRICPQCHEDKPLAEWGKPFCRTCVNKRRARYRAEHPQNNKKHHDAWRARRRGALVEDFDRLEIFERDNWICQLCGDPTDREAAPRSSRAPSLDHIVPLSQGGTHTRANAQTACLGCNARKGARLAM